MFPGQLAEGPFSLRPNERGTALSLSADLSPYGELQSHSIVASHIIPTQKMTYAELDEAVASGCSDRVSESLQALLEVVAHHLTCSEHRDFPLTMSAEDRSSSHATQLSRIISNEFPCTLG